MWETFEKSPLLKLLILTFGMLMLVYFVILPTISISTVPMNPYNYQISIMSGNGFGIYSLLSTLGKALLLLSSIGFIASIIIYLTNRLNVVETNPRSEIKADELSVKECINCGSKLQIDWQCCPRCGVDINKQISHEVETTAELNIETVEESMQVKTEETKQEAKDDLVERIYQGEANKEKKKNSKTKKNTNQNPNRK